MSARLILAVLAVLWVLCLTAGLIASGITRAFAHGWYDAVCCDGDAHSGDCQAIPAASVKAVEGGWQVTLVPGQHRLVTKPHTYFKPYEQTRKSQDNDFHACLWPQEDKLQCLYAPAMSG